MSKFLADCRHAVRLYIRTPGASLIAVAVLAIGLAFVSSFLSLYVDLVLRPYPGFQDSGDIVTVGWNDGENMRGLLLDLVDRANDESASLEGLVGFHWDQLLYGPERDPLSVEYATRGFFGALRPRLMFGRGLEPEEHNVDAALVTVISHKFWETELGSDPTVLGTTIEITAREESHAFRIIGVMAPEMQGITSPQISAWLPLERMIALYLAPGQIEPYGTWLTTLGRKVAGASDRAVANELDSRFADAMIDARLSAGYRLDAIGGVVNSIGAKRESVRQLNAFLTGSILLGLVAACNVSLFLLARAPGRRRELGIRMAVGASLSRLARQLSSEGAVLVAASTALGLLLSVWLSTYLRSLAFLRRAEWRDVALLDWRVLGLVSVFLMFVTLIVSIAPILGLKKLSIAETSRQVAARATPVQRIAGATQLAISAAFAGAAIAFAWYLGVMVFSHPGYETDDRYLAAFATRSFNDEVDPSRLRESILSVPGNSNATITTVVPGGSAVSNLPGAGVRRVPDPLDAALSIEYRSILIDEHYVDVLGLRLLHGRAPDASGLDSALVNQTLARRYFGRENVVGEMLPLDNGAQRVPIVGVLEDLSYDHPYDAVPPTAHFSFPNDGLSFVILAIIESESRAAELQQQLQELVNRGELEVGLFLVSPLGELRDDIIAPDRARAFLTIATGALVVALAGFGFFGIQRYLVTAGRREYAIRASLGAGPRSLGRLVLWRSLLLGLPGMAVGLPFVFVVVSLLHDDYLARDISPMAVTAAVSIGLALLLITATLAPATEARRSQPAPLLRED